MMSASTAKRSPPSELRHVMLRHAPLYRKALLFSLIVNLLVLAPTLFMLEVYDRVVTSRSGTTLVMLLILVIGAYVVMQLLDYLRMDAMSRAAMGIDAALRVRIFDATFESSLKRGAAGGGLHVFGDLKTLREFLPSGAVMSAMEAPAAVVFLIIVSLIDPWLGLLALIGAVIQVTIAVRTEKRTMPTLTESNQAAIQAQNYANNALRNTQVIEAMGMLGSMRGRWMTMQRRFLRLQADASDHGGMNNAIGRFIQTMQGSLILGASCWLAVKGDLSGGGGMMIVASTLGGRALAPLVQLVAQWRLVVNARDAYGRINELLSSNPAKGAGMSLPPPTGRLTVEAVFAAAPGSPAPILRGVNFAALPGEVVAVLGPSAAGKTTLARLLIGAWPAMSGKVRLDGADVYAWNKDELGQHVGYLPQAVELFDGSVAENIARFGHVDMDKVRAAAQLAGLGALIESLPDGYDTRIGDEGAFLSGGQRQRVALARAAYGLPRFIVLDEPNSSLDDAGEAALAQALARFKSERCTTVVISHRASLLPSADKLLLLQDGQVSLFGPRDEVLAKMQQAAAAQSAAQAQQRGAAVPTPTAPTATPRPVAAVTGALPGAAPGAVHGASS